MRVTEVTVSRERKVNRGNFENESFFVAVKGTVDSDEQAESVGNALSEIADTILAKNLQVGERVSGPAQDRNPSEGEPTGDSAPRLAAAHPADHLAVKVTGAKLKDDAEGRQWLKDHGFKFQGTDASWRGRIVRDPKEIAALNQWTKARNLEIEFAPVEG